MIKDAEAEKQVSKSKDVNKELKKNFIAQL
jgi:hypothetical protein